jgi:hypothetical protein
MSERQPLAHRRRGHPDLHGWPPVGLGPGGIFPRGGRFSWHGATKNGGGMPMFIRDFPPLVVFPGPCPGLWVSPSVLKN